MPVRLWWDVADGGGGGDSLCERGCDDTIAVDCPNGPTEQQACVSECEMLEQGSCSTEFIDCLNAGVR